MSNGICQTEKCNRYHAEATYVAECTNGSVGAAQKVTAQGVSFRSYEEAKRNALDNAKEIALSRLVCVWSSTQSWRPACDPEHDPIEATETSTISQADADNKATVAAQAAALAFCA